MTPQTPEQIAGKLTKAQRKWLPTFREEPFGGTAIGMSKQTRQSLLDAGLIAKHVPAHFRLIKWSLTEAGIAVLAHITGDGE